MAEDPNPSSLSQELCQATLFDSPEWIESSPDFEESPPIESSGPQDPPQQRAPEDSDVGPDGLVKTAFREIARVKNINHLHFGSDFGGLQDSTKLRRAQAVNKVKKTLIELIAGGDTEELENLVDRHMKQGIWSGEATKKTHQLMLRIAETVNNAGTPNERWQALSIACGTYPYATVVAYIPGLTKYAFSCAAFHARHHGTGAREPAQLLQFRVKYDKEKVNEYINYITSSMVVFDMPYGLAKGKYTDGTAETIPSICRVYLNQNIIYQYKEYLKQSGKQHLQMSDCSYWKILRFCPAKTRISLHGLDSYTHAGTEGFDTLSKYVG